MLLNATRSLKSSWWKSPLLLPMFPPCYDHLCVLREFICNCNYHVRCRPLVCHVPLNRFGCFLYLQDILWNPDVKRAVGHCLGLHVGESDVFLNLWNWSAFEGDISVWKCCDHFRSAYRSIINVEEDFSWILIKSSYSVSNLQVMQQPRH